MNRLENLECLKMAWNLVEDWNGWFELNHHPDRGEACCWHAEFNDYRGRQGIAWGATPADAILRAHTYMSPIADQLGMLPITDLPDMEPK